VVPVRDEVDNIAPLVEEIRRSLDGRLDYELIYVDDGSDDCTWQRLAELAWATPQLRPIRHRAGYGQSAALRTGVAAAHGDAIVTLDGDGQNDPADIPRLLQILWGERKEGPLLVLGHRLDRQASRVRRISSWLANGVRGRLLGDRVPDSGCGLKAFHREAFLGLPYFDHMHRFLPSLFLRAGGRVVSVPVNDRGRLRGASKYGVSDRLWVGIVDLLGVLWLQARGQLPVLDDGTGMVFPRRQPGSRLAGSTAWWVAVWLALVASTLFFRPLLPVDETRYVAVAWEMWLRGDLVVPYLNGAPYADKPPLLFWAIHLGWRVFGVNDWWARLVAPLFGLGAVALTAALARQLWPGRPDVARLAAPFLLGSAAWAFFTTLTMCDTALTFFVLLGLLGVARARQADARAGWGMLALALGLGILAKGPVVVLFLVPVAVSAPWWGRTGRPWSSRWYVALTGAVAVGIVIALAWALPAAQRGGTAYRDALLWGQTINRLTASFAHRQPVWWYLPVLPAALLPWSIWPRVWRAGAGARGEPGVRFVVVWFAAAFAGLSLISGKQVHYLLPLVPAAALLAARVLTDCALGPGGRRFRALALAGPLLVVLANAAVSPMTRGAYDVRALACRIHGWQESGRAVAHVGKYHGQFHFVGRLRAPLEVIPEGTERQWLLAHPGGKVIAYQARDVPLPRGAEFTHPYRVRTAIVLGEAARSGVRPARPDG
jgi:hypothetical protein